MGDIALLMVAVFFIPDMVWKNRGAPFVPSQRKSVRKIIALADIKAGDKAVDLGSGDGRIVIALAKAGAEAHGYEINPTLVAWSRFRIILAGLSGKAFIHQRSFWEENLSSYNVVALFGITKIMDKLGQKLSSELKPDTKIISNVFKFSDWELVKQDEEIYLYTK